MRSILARAFVAVAVLALQACSGGSIYGSTTSGGGSGGTPTPALLDLLASSTQLSSSADSQTAGITLTALVRDSSSNVLANEPVTFSISPAGSGGIIVTRSTTDSGGTAQAVVTTGGNPQNRTFTVTATAGAASGSVDITVVGTTIGLTGPSSTQFNTATTYTAQLIDSSNRGISGKTVAVTSTAGNTISATSLVTNSSGQVTFSYTATTNSATDTITVSSLGVSASKTVSISLDNFRFTAPASGANVDLNTNQVVTITWTRGSAGVAGASVTLASTRGTFYSATDCATGSLGSSATVLTNASGVATFNLCSADAGIANISANGDDGAGATPTASTQIEFIATTPSTIAVQALPTRIATNSTSEIQAIVRDAAGNLVKNSTVNFTLVDPTNGTLSAPSAVTNSQGVAKVIYTASSTTSAADGVQVSATVASNTAITGTVALTVGGQGARITIGTGNKILIPSDTLYQLPYTVLVTDNAGNPVAGAVVTLQVLPTKYEKGAYGTNATTGALEPVYTVSPACDNEDIDYDGFLDVGEDFNGNTVLDPGNIATVPSTVTVGSDGTATFNVTYFKDRGNWVEVQLTASTTVSGNQANAVQVFTLPIADADKNNPPGYYSPYGQAADCSDPT